jgi:hypothetical protein
MKAKYLFFLSNFFALLSHSQSVTGGGKDLIIATGRMPNITKDKSNNIHIVYGTGDSIMYLSSTNKGKSFSSPALVAVLPKVFASAMRGPQITATANGLIITANTTYGNIYAYQKPGAGSWSKAMKVNDVDSVSKEALMSLGADGVNAFAVWLDNRGNDGKAQRLYGAQSKDGGKTWSKNILVYASPDKTICECCKPSVAIKGNNVYAMFRNWINGNRDLYLIASTNGGKTFGEAQKLGVGSWKLNGCPMDGGGLVINDDGTPQTVWRREAKIYAATPGYEKELGEGRGCSMETVNGKNIYAWTSDGNVVVVKPQGEKKVLGKGSQPLLKGLNNEHVICVWENDKQIHAQVLEL